MRVAKADFNRRMLAALLVMLTLLACDTQQVPPAHTSNQAVATSPTPPLPPPLNTGISNWMPSIPTDVSGHQLITPWPTDDGPLDTPTPVSTLSPKQKIAPDLAQAMIANPNDLSFGAVLVEQNRGGGVEDAENLANRTQPPVKAALDELKRQGQVTSYRSFWIFNGFSVKGTANAVTTLAKRSDISQLELDSGLRPNVDKPIPLDAAPPSSTGTPHQLYNSAAPGRPQCCRGESHTPSAPHPSLQLKDESRRKSASASGGCTPRPPDVHRPLPHNR